MSDLLARAGAFFLTPEATAPKAVAAPGPTVDLAIVVAAPCHAPAAAGGVAAALRRQARARAAVVCAQVATGNEMPAGWERRSAPGNEPLEGVRVRSAGTSPALPAAARLARRLAARDIAATAAGALCQVALPPVAEDAIREAWRVMGAAGDAPVVVAITRRTDELDAFLAQADRLYLATASDDAYTHLALESLATLGPQTALLRPPTGILARRAAAFGLTELRAATSAREEAPA